MSARCTPLTGANGPTVVPMTSYGPFRPAIDPPKTSAPDGWQRFWDDASRPLPGSALLAVLVAAVLGSWVSVTRPGLGVLLLALTLWAMVVAPMSRDRRWADLALGLLAVALVSVLVWRDSPAVGSLAVLAAVGIATVASVGARTAVSVLISPVLAAATAVRTVPWLFAGAFRRASSGRRASAGIVGAILVTGILVIVFGSLFASADPVFAQLVPTFEPRDVPGRVAAGIFWAAVAAWVTHMALVPTPARDLKVGRSTPSRLLEWMLPMGALVALTAAFVLVQVGDLLGGTHSLVARTGLSHAEYARQGFGQLLAATALMIGVVVVAAGRAPRESSTQKTTTTATLLLLGVVTLGVVASALRRMNLYVAEFGLSELRVLATWAEIVLALLLVAGMVAAALWRVAWLPRTVLAIVGIAVLGLAVWNPDARIVRSNLAAPHSTDLPYLSTLSADAVPVIAQLPEPMRSDLLNAYSVPKDDWASWNASRWAAEEILSAQG
jgi:hypothetical protein